MTLYELAESWLSAQRTIICETSGNFHRDFTELLEFIEEEVNPLLLEHGAGRLDTEEIEYTFLERTNSEDDEDDLTDELVW